MKFAREDFLENDFYLQDNMFLDAFVGIAELGDNLIAKLVQIEEIK